MAPAGGICDPVGTCSSFFFLHFYAPASDDIVFRFSVRACVWMRMALGGGHPCHIDTFLVYSITFLWL